MRAKFISTTNKGIAHNVPLDTFLPIKFSDTITYEYSDTRYFKTSMIEHFTWDKKTKYLTVWTINSMYEFELEKDTFCSSQIQCTDKREIESIRISFETEVLNGVVVSVLTPDGQTKQSVCMFNPKVSFNDAKAILLGKEYKDDAVQGKVLHIMHPADFIWD